MSEPLLVALAVSAPVVLGAIGVGWVLFWDLRK